MLKKIYHYSFYFTVVLFPVGQSTCRILSHICKCFLIIVTSSDLSHSLTAMDDPTTTIKEMADSQLRSTFPRQAKTRTMQRKGWSHIMSGSTFLLLLLVSRKCSQLRQVSAINQLSPSQLLSTRPKGGAVEPLKCLATRDKILHVFNISLCIIYMPTHLPINEDTCVNCKKKEYIFLMYQTKDAL